MSKVIALLSFVNGLTTFSSELISLVSGLTFSVSGLPAAIRTLVIRVREEESADETWEAGPIGSRELYSWMK